MGHRLYKESGQTQDRLKKAGEQICIPLEESVDRLKEKVETADRPLEGTALALGGVTTIPNDAENGQNCGSRYLILSSL